MAARANSKPCQTSEIELFRKLLLVTETNSESWKTSMMEICVSIDYDQFEECKEVFIYFGLSIANRGVSLNIFTFCNLRKAWVFFNPSVSNQMSLIVASVDNSA